MLDHRRPLLLDCLSDSMTVLQKEIIETRFALAAGGVVRRLYILTALGSAVLAYLHITSPQQHPLWILLAWLLIPVPLIAVTMTDSFAGEHEQGTYHPLRMTPVSPTALWAGKVIASTLLVWTLYLISCLIALTLILFSGAISQVSHMIAVIPSALAMTMLNAAFVALTASVVLARATTIRKGLRRLAWSFAIMVAVFLMLLLLLDGNTVEISQRLPYLQDLNIAPLPLFLLFMLGIDTLLSLLGAYRFSHFSAPNG